jgi:hypothetical protein
MKRRGNVLSLVQKFEILDKLKSGDTVVSFARFNNKHILLSFFILPNIYV